MASLWVGVLILLSLSFSKATLVPCAVTLDEIRNATLIAYASRASCERSYFTGDACDTYWMQAGDLLQLEYNFKACRNLEVDEFLTFLVGPNWNNGEIVMQAQITRDAVAYNAQATQALFTAQSVLTRAELDLDAQTTQTVLTSVTDTQNALTQTNLTLEAQATRATVTAEAVATISTVESESVATRAEIDAQEAQTRAWITTEATATQTYVGQQHDITRANISAEAQATRAEIDAQEAQTRALVSSESDQTRTVLAADITADGAASRANTSAEAALTRQTVVTTANATQSVVTTQASTTRSVLTSVFQADGNATRAAILTQGTATRQTIANQSSVTQATVLSSANNTNVVIQAGIESLNASIANLQESQVLFVQLFVKILIEASFSADPNAGRIDLFQRLAADGGYYETMKAVVLDVTSYNLAKYHSTISSYTVSLINAALSSAASYESEGLYRQAWAEWRLAYLYAVSP